MTIKIKAPKAWAYETLAGEVSSSTASTKTKNACIPVRIIRESDWRKLMRLVKAADEHYHSDPREICAICYPLATLKEKRK